MASTLVAVRRAASSNSVACPFRRYPGAFPVQARRKRATSYAPVRPDWPARQPVRPDQLPLKMALRTIWSLRVHRLSPDWVEANGYTTQDICFHQPVGFIRVSARSFRRKLDEELEPIGPDSISERPGDWSGAIVVSQN